MTPNLSTGSDCASVQGFVLRHLGGRAYRSPVPVAVRVPVMRSRTTRHSTRTLATLALASRAVSSYLGEIGDREAAARWGEMADDLGIVLNGRSL